MAVLKILILFLLIVGFEEFVQCEDFDPAYYDSLESTFDAPDPNPTDISADNELTHVRTKNLSGNIKLTTLEVLTTNRPLDELNNGFGNEKNGIFEETTDERPSSGENKHDGIQTITENQQNLALLSEVRTKAPTDGTEPFGLMDGFNGTSGTVPDQTSTEKLINVTAFVFELIDPTEKNRQAKLSAEKLAPTTENTTPHFGEAISGDGMVSFSTFQSDTVAETTTRYSFVDISTRVVNAAEEMITTEATKQSVNEDFTSARPTAEEQETTVKNEEIYSTTAVFDGGIISVSEASSEETSTLPVMSLEYTANKRMDRGHEDIEDLSSFMKIDEDFLNAVTDSKELEDLSAAIEDISSILRADEDNSSFSADTDKELEDIEDTHVASTTIEDKTEKMSPDLITTTQIVEATEEYEISTTIGTDSEATTRFTEETTKFVQSEIEFEDDSIDEDTDTAKGYTMTVTSVSQEIIDSTKEYKVISVTDKTFEESTTFKEINGKLNDNEETSTIVNQLEDTTTRSGNKKVTEEENEETHDDLDLEGKFEEENEDSKIQNKRIIEATTTGNDSEVTEFNEKIIISGRNNSEESSTDDDEIEETMQFIHNENEFEDDSPEEDIETTKGYEMTVISTSQKIADSTEEYKIISTTDKTSEESTTVKEIYTKLNDNEETSTIVNQLEETVKINDDKKVAEENEETRNLKGTEDETILEITNKLDEESKYEEIHEKNGESTIADDEIEETTKFVPNDYEDESIEEDIDIFASQEITTDKALKETSTIFNQLEETIKISDDKKVSEEENEETHYLKSTEYDGIIKATTTKLNKEDEYIGIEDKRTIEKHLTNDTEEIDKENKVTRKQDQVITANQLTESRNNETVGDNTEEHEIFTIIIPISEEENEETHKLNGTEHVEENGYSQIQDNRILEERLTEDSEEIGKENEVATRQNDNQGHDLLVANTYNASNQEYNEENKIFTTIIPIAEEENEETLNLKGTEQNGILTTTDKLDEESEYGRWKMENNKITEEIDEKNEATKKHNDNAGYDASVATTTQLSLSKNEETAEEHEIFTTIIPILDKENEETRNLNGTEHVEENRYSQIQNNRILEEHLTEDSEDMEEENKATKKQEDNENYDVTLTTTTQLSQLQNKENGQDRAPNEEYTEEHEIFTTIISILDEENEETRKLNDTELDDDDEEDLTKDSEEIGEEIETTKKQEGNEGYDASVTTTTELSQSKNKDTGEDRAPDEEYTEEYEIFTKIISILDEENEEMHKLNGTEHDDDEKNLTKDTEETGEENEVAKRQNDNVGYDSLVTTKYNASNGEYNEENEETRNLKDTEQNGILTITNKLDGEDKYSQTENNKITEEIDKRNEATKKQDNEDYEAVTTTTQLSLSRNKKIGEDSAEDAANDEENERFSTIKTINNFSIVTTPNSSFKSEKNKTDTDDIETSVTEAHDTILDNLVTSFHSSESEFNLTTAEMLATDEIKDNQTELPQISVILSGKKIRLSIKITTNESNFFIPPYAFPTYPAPGAINITWNSSHHALNNSLVLNIGNSVRLNIVKDNRMHTYKSENKSEDVDKHIIVLDDGIRVHFSVDLLKRDRPKTIITPDALPSTPNQRDTLAAEIIGGCVGFSVIAAVVGYFIIKKFRGKTRNFKPNSSA